MSRTWTIVMVLAAAAGCGNTPLVGSQTEAAAPAQCLHDPSVGTGAPGACVAGRAVVDCELPGDARCGCVTDDTYCGGCQSGATCTNKCTEREYGAGCGSAGPGDPSITYAAPPAGCRVVYTTHGNDAFFCCPCL